MSDTTYITVDGNEAVARIAHITNDVLPIYPITPASSMGEWADLYSTQEHKNLWGSIPTVVEMQSEAGAAGTMHGALQGGAMSSTFTSSQGLLLMIPNLYKIVGELTPCVIHVAARSIATHALSIFCDHSDVMACRATGAGIWFSNSVQDAQDGALLSQMFSLKSRLPFIHVFDGFRTSHEVAKIESLAEDQVRALFPWDEAEQHRNRAMTPERPNIRGTSQNPDVFFQSRERTNSVYDNAEQSILDSLEQFKQETGREYQPYEYFGADDAEKVIVLMGSGVETAKETIASLIENNDAKIGVISVRLYRPFASKLFSDTIPTTTKHIAVLDRTKEPGASAEPLFLDACCALMKQQRGNITLSNGRYGLGSKEFTPAMIVGLLDAMDGGPIESFSMGINDDLTERSIPYSSTYKNSNSINQRQAVFYGLGSDGTVSANKNSIKILGEQSGRYVQGYFEYDSKKSGAVTISHLRFAKQPIQSTYLIENDSADFVACHQFNLLEKYDVLAKAKQGTVFLVNSPFPAEDTWDQFPQKTQQALIEKQCQIYTIDAYQLAKELGLGRRINTIMQSCFFAISEFFDDKDFAIKLMQDFSRKTYRKAGQRILDANDRAITTAAARVVKITPTGIATHQENETTAAMSDDFLSRITQPAMQGMGNLIPVSHLPLDGTYPTGTAKLEKRNVSQMIPEWNPDICIQCGKCVMVCPHAVIRSKLIAGADTEGAPETFKQVRHKKNIYGKGWSVAFQVSPEDCTGCELCVNICPSHDDDDPDKKALNMIPKAPVLEQEKENWSHFLNLPSTDNHILKTSTIPGASLADPMFEFSGACSGCGETPYITLITRLFGDRMIIGNATGCSSIYGGNLPTTPYTTNSKGRGPVWNNSLFEDNAEFTLGLRTSVNQLTMQAFGLLLDLKDQLPKELVEELDTNQQVTEQEIFEQRQSVELLLKELAKLESYKATRLAKLSEYLVKKSVWAFGGDGWAYDIGFGGLDHVLASGENINILVLDTEVYSNTGGQMSKATPMGAIAKFAASGRLRPKKDLAAHAMNYKDVYVAQIAFGAKDSHTLHAITEAENYPGTSIIIAYSPCIAHGIDLKNNIHQQHLAVNSGHWSLLRYNPLRVADGLNPLEVDYKQPFLPIGSYMETEARFSVLKRTHPEAADAFIKESQRHAQNKYSQLHQLAELTSDETSNSEKAK